SRGLLAGRGGEVMTRFTAPSGRLSLQVTFDSDWHVGSGAGRPGLIDRLIVRDADNLPFVPAKTITGIWRDACERLVRGLDETSTEKPWHGWLDRIFGDQAT